MHQTLGGTGGDYHYDLISKLLPPVALSSPILGPSRPDLEVWGYRYGIKPPPSSSCFPSPHVPPFSISCLSSRGSSGRRGNFFATPTSSSAGIIPTGGQELTGSRPEWRISPSTPCTSGSGPSIIATVYLSLAWPRGCQSRQRTSSSLRGICKHP